METMKADLKMLGPRRRFVGINGPQIFKLLVWAVGNKMGWLTHQRSKLLGS